MKRYFDLNYNGEPYDALGRRKGNELYYIGAGNKPQQKKNTGATAGARNGVPKKAPAGYKPPGGIKKGGFGNGAGGGDTKKVQELSGEIAELKLTSDTLEKERDFYFGKLRDIEILLQHNDQENPATEMVMKILYATEDEKVEIDDQGNLLITNANGELVEDTPAGAEEDNQPEENIEDI